MRAGGQAHPEPTSSARAPETVQQAVQGSSAPRREADGSHSQVSLMSLAVPPILTSNIASPSKLPIDEEDIGIVFEDLHRGRSIVPPHAIPSRPALVRWDPTRPLTMDNCVPFDEEDAERHEKECYGDAGRRPEEVWGAEVAAVVVRRAEEIKREREAVM